ncbi:MAG: NAD(P)/FAD-dependent oxidoreductase, partial [Calditrichia bacterium]
MAAATESEIQVVGSGPNGLAAAIVCARAGFPVTLFEAEPEAGGGVRSAELTLPGYLHDVCSAVHPLARSSPLFSSLPLAESGLNWIKPDYALAHPLDNGDAALLSDNLEITLNSFQHAEDAHEYGSQMETVLPGYREWLGDVLSPFPFPRHPVKLATFGILAAQSAAGFIHRHFRGDPARGFFAGLAAHSMLSLNQPFSCAFGLVLAVLGHVNNWPFPAGGAGSLTAALITCLEKYGGKIEKNHPVLAENNLDPAAVKFLDLVPRQVLQLLGHRIPEKYRSGLQRYRYGPGVFKVDWALSRQIPFVNPDCRHAGTVHLGGKFEEILQAEEQVFKGMHPEKPFVILAQPSVFDPERTPAGGHTAWAYCHVPNGSDQNMTEAVERQVERFAPGFSQCILARFEKSAVQMEGGNPNYVGGDINGGLMDWRQLITRPVFRFPPYKIPLE